MRKTKDDIDRLAAKIARDLLTSGSGNKERADRLVLTIDCPERRTMGGWSEVGLANRIAQMLRLDRKRADAKPKLGPKRKGK